MRALPICLRLPYNSGPYPKTVSPGNPIPAMPEFLPGRDNFVSGTLPLLGENVCLMDPAKDRSPASAIQIGDFAVLRGVGRTYRPHLFNRELEKVHGYPEIFMKTRYVREESEESSHPMLKVKVLKQRFWHIHS